MAAYFSPLSDMNKMDDDDEMLLNLSFETDASVRLLSFISLENDLLQRQLTMLANVQMMFKVFISFKLKIR
jgi:hypothetical protein